MSTQKVILKIPVSFELFFKSQLNRFLYLIGPKIFLLILIAYDVFIILLDGRTMPFAVIFTLALLGFIFVVVPLIKISRFKKNKITILEYEFNSKTFIGKSKMDKMEFKKEAMKQIKIRGRHLILKLSMGSALIIPLPKKDLKDTKRDLKELGWI